MRVCNQCRFVGTRPIPSSHGLLPPVCCPKYNILSLDRPHTHIHQTRFVSGRPREADFVSCIDGKLARGKGFRSFMGVVAKIRSEISKIPTSFVTRVDRNIFRGYPLI